VRLGGVTITFGEGAGRTFDGKLELILFGQIISFYQETKKKNVKDLGYKHDIGTQNPSSSYRN
jgi:hypothetical protein